MPPLPTGRPTPLVGGIPRGPPVTSVGPVFKMTVSLIEAVP